MKVIDGIYLPSGDEHFSRYLPGSPRHRGAATYQFKKYRAAMRFVKRRGHAVDIGSHVGLWTRLMADDFSHVTCFEPLAAHRECWLMNTRHISNAELYPLALSNEEQTLRIHMPQDNTGHAHVSEKGEEVQAVTLDSRAGLERIDFLKIDVEGWELPVVQGAEARIRLDRPVIIIEQKPDNAEAQGFGRWSAVNLLKKWGAVEVDQIAGDHILVWR